MVSFLGSGFRNAKLTSYQSAKGVLDFPVPRNGRLLSGTAVHVDVVFGAMSHQKGTFPYQFADKFGSLQEVSSTVMRFLEAGNMSIGSVSIIRL